MQQFNCPNRDSFWPLFCSLKENALLLQAHFLCLGVLTTLVPRYLRHYSFWPPCRQFYLLTTWTWYKEQIWNSEPAKLGHCLAHLGLTLSWDATWLQFSQTWASIGRAPKSTSGFPTRFLCHFHCLSFSKEPFLTLLIPVISCFIWKPILWIVYYLPSALAKVATSFPWNSFRCRIYIDVKLM